ncbi:MAG: hypothetical protein SFT68_01535 [Rickettsiaceae bacterium]|nr:hypothetical protein [Rickettsiaceae bacterium]
MHLDKKPRKIEEELSSLNSNSLNRLDTDDKTSSSDDMEYSDDETASIYSEED